MPFTIPYEQHELPTEGTHPAVVDGLEDLGVVTGKFGPKPMMNIVFKLVNRTKSNGESFRIKERYTKSLFREANLFKAVRAIAGLDPSRDFDLERLIGMQVDVVIKHNTSQSDGLTYANIALILKTKTATEKRGDQRIDKAKAKSMKAATPAHDAMTRPQQTPTNGEITNGNDSTHRL